MHGAPTRPRDPRGPLNQPPAAPLSGVARLWASRKHGQFLSALLVWLIILIMTVPQGLDFQGENGMPTSSDLLSRIVWIILIGGGGYLCYTNLARVKMFIRYVNPFLWMFLGLAALSVLWSIEPAITRRRVTRLLTILMVCVGVSVSYTGPRRFQEVLRSLATWVLIASVIMVAMDPEDSIHHSHQAELKDAWHGITIGKNVLGSIASTTFILWTHAWLDKQAGAFRALCGMSLATLCLVMSRSSTSLMATAFAVTFMLILLRSPGSMRRYLPYLVGTFATIILIYCLAVLRLIHGLDFILEPIAAITGKDLTFTGRTAIWEVLNEHIRLRPLLGTGYGAYWIGATPTSPSFEMLTRLYFYPTEGHNGYLDVINDLGAVGGFCLLGYFVSYVRQGLLVMRFDRYQGGLYLTMLFRGFIADMSESHWFLVLSFDFVIMTLATMAMARSEVQAFAENKSGPAPRPTPAPPPARAPRRRASLIGSG